MKPLFYLASPYAGHPRGLDNAYNCAVRALGVLLAAGHNVFSPIAHNHPAAVAAGIPPGDHGFWLPIDQPYIDRCDALIVLAIEGWSTSKGVRYEVEQFDAAGKLIFHMEPFAPPAGLADVTPKRQRQTVQKAPGTCAAPGCFHLAARACERPDCPEVYP